MKNGIKWKIATIAAIITNSGVTQYSDFKDAYRQHVKLLLTGSPCKLVLPNGEELFVESVTDGMEIKYRGFDTPIGLYTLNEQIALLKENNESLKRSHARQIKRLGNHIDTSTIDVPISPLCYAELRELNKCHLEEIQYTATLVNDLAQHFGWTGDYRPNDVATEALRVIKAQKAVLTEHVKPIL